ncbi:MAG: family 20 glycosylhydrolase [Fimbriimonadaceae bacterium]|nr:family 20 glycosylhydrolase [Fimbriimonadaceae bacterium]
MPWKLWTLDVAREQSPSFDLLARAGIASQNGGYNALGLYLEHRFAYPGVEWAHGEGCLQPATVRRLIEEFPSLEVVPFLNLLGHMEGFLYCEEGQAMAEEPMRGMQGNMGSEGFQELCSSIVRGALESFAAEVVHLGGDEAGQLGRHPDSVRRAEGAKGDAKAWLYGQHFAPYCQQVLAAGRRPALWADMILEHPEAADAIPKQTLLFDWQYRTGCEETTRRLQDMGFEVVCCPTIHAYDAAWTHLTESEANVRTVARDAARVGAAGLCLTTWEAGLFGNYATVFPSVEWAGRVFDDPELDESMVEAYGDGSAWAHEMGVVLNQSGGLFSFDGHRSRLKCRLLLFGNPFLLWRHHRAELCGEPGTRALQTLERAKEAAANPAQLGVVSFVRAAIEFTRVTEVARNEYRAGNTEQCVAALATLRRLFDDLAALARHNALESGGSLADVERCVAAKRHVETAILRVRAYGQRELGYLPAFEVLTDPRFVPHDQGCWWIVNRWGLD